MRVAIFGAGVIGVTSAWYLAEAGHEVTIVDRQPGPAHETSFANAGEICPSHATPWAAPGVPLKALAWLAQRHAPLIVRAGAIDPTMLRWLVAMARNCTAARFAINRDRMMRLAAYSRDALVALRAATGIDYHQRRLGTLQTCGSQSELDRLAADARAVEAHGLRCEILDREACLRAEPGLAGATAAIAGGVRMPDDETGDCFLFTRELAALAVDKGTRFVAHCLVRGIRIERGRIDRVETDLGPITADAYLFATASDTPALLRSAGLDLPIYPVKGYSITAPIADFDRAPVSTVLDGDLKLAITRLGDRIRVGGLAELAGFARDLPQRRRATLDLALKRLFPGAADLAHADFWSGLRPMTPDSTPIVGPTPIANLFVNAGHGTMGWTMACGSARIIADILSGRPTDIRSDDLGLARYGPRIA